MKIRFVCAAAAALFAGLASAQGPAGGAAQAPAAAAAETASPAARIASRIRANDLKADVSFLASDALEGRGTPSRGLDIAAEFVASQFRRAGLEPVGDDGYFQTAPYVQTTPNLDGLELTIETGGKTIRVEKGSMALADPAALELSRAPIVKAALNAAGLTAEGARGKVVLLEGGRGGRVPSAILALHPALVLMVQSNPMPAMPARLKEAAAESVPAVIVWDKAVKDAFSEAAAGPLEAVVSVKIPAPAVVPVKLRNVIGVLAGSDPALKDTYVLVTAHYDHLGIRGTGEGDHIYNGANDDASGTASVIEIADALASLPAHPRRSIVFVALFGEELGLLGSRYYAAHPVYPLARTVADLNLEHMGRTDTTEGTRVGMVNATGYDFTTITTDLKKAGEETGIDVAKDEKNSDSFYARSDNQAFADAGVPAHTLSVGYIFPDYHRPGDEWPKLDYDNMARVDRAVALGIFEIADSTSAPQWNTANPKTERYAKARENATR